MSESGNDARQPEESVEIGVDQEKVEAWDEVKSDYQVEPDGEPVPNSMDTATSDTAREDERAVTEEGDED
jgi:hypothetical protein